MTCATCCHSAEVWNGRALVFICQRDGYPVRVMRFWSRACYLREPGAEG